MNDLKSESICITHVVNPHQFYFKCTSDVGNSEFAKFDFEIQIYANARIKQTDELDYVPVENELVIFYHIIYNKWIRGRVVSLGQEITFWCIDNGIWEKWAAPHVLPLTERFHEDMKLVHLGGLSLVPTEKTLNVETVDVETHLSKQWDVESINLFKRIIDTSKTFIFTKEFQMVDHKFGSLAIESKNATKEINKILLAMNKVAPSNQYDDEDFFNYVHEQRLEAQLHQSIVNDSLIQHPAKLNDNNISMKTVRRSSIKSGSVMSSKESLRPNDDFDDSKSRGSSSDLSVAMESQTKPSRHTNHHTNARQQSNMVRCEITKKTEISAAENEFLDDSDDSVSLVSSSTDNRMSSLLQNDLKLMNDEGYLRSYKANFPEKVQRQPLETTVAWIDSMVHQSRSSDSASSASSTVKFNGEGRSTSTLSSTKNGLNKHSNRLGSLLATLAKNPSSKSPKIVNDSVIGGKMFGVPAGYAKNDLDTFGGLNVNKK